MCQHSGPNLNLLETKIHFVLKYKVILIPSSTKKSQQQAKEKMELRLRGELHSNFVYIKELLREHNFSLASSYIFVLAEKAKPKAKKKEEPSSIFQRHRVDALLLDLRQKFPPRFVQV